MNHKTCVKPVEEESKGAEAIEKTIKLYEERIQALKPILKDLDRIINYQKNE